MTDALTLSEVAAILRVGVESVRRYVRAGLIPAVRVGRAWIVERSAVDAYVATLRRNVP